VDFWFQDEARLGQQNTTTRLWAERGTRPRAVKQQQLSIIKLPPYSPELNTIVSVWQTKKSPVGKLGFFT